jgi:hypothetical protein
MLGRIPIDAYDRGQSIAPTVSDEPCGRSGFRKRARPRSLLSKRPRPSAGRWRDAHSRRGKRPQFRRRSPSPRLVPGSSAYSSRAGIRDRRTGRRSWRECRPQPDRTRRLRADSLRATRMSFACPRPGSFRELQACPLKRRGDPGKLPYRVAAHDRHGRIEAKTKLSSFIPQAAAAASPRRRSPSTSARRSSAPRRPPSMANCARSASIT